MWSCRIVVLPPVLDDGSRLGQIGKEAFIQIFVPQPAVDGEDGPAPEKGQYAGPTYKRSIPNDPNHRGP